MDLSLDESQTILVDTFSEMLAKECSSAHVRDCEATGYSPGLWTRYCKLGAHLMGLPAESGGLDMDLLELGLVAAESGRVLAPVPFLEVAAVGRLLARVCPDHPLLASLAEGQVSASLVIPRPDAVSGTTGRRSAALAPFGAVADTVLVLDDDALLAVDAAAARCTEHVRDLGSGALARWDVARSQDARVLATGHAAKAAMTRAVTEWNLLAGFWLVGLARRALEIGSDYARERVQFGVPIGGFQSIAHPLAECAIRVDGAELLCWEAAWAHTEDAARFEMLASMAFAWGAQTAIQTTDVSLHTHGGYGFSTEYDIQLYFRRARALASIAGGAREGLQTVARRYVERSGQDPTRRRDRDAGMDFRLGPEAETVQREIRAFLREHFSEAERQAAKEDGGGHDWDLYRKLAAQGWVSAGWPEEYGGSGRDPYEVLVLYWELSKADFPWFGLVINSFIGHSLLAMGTDHQRQEFVPRIASGEIAFALGYSEPGAGSDIANARTTATRDGDDWIIDGQKMWTTIAHEVQYIFMLTRTSTHDRPHRGLTMFIVPTDAEGVDIQAIHTMGGERTNAVYLSSVRVPDAYRIGEVDQGWAVIRFALSLEQAMGYAELHERFVEEVGRWTLERGPDGERPVDDPRVREQLGQSAIHAEVSRLLRHRATWLAAESMELGAKGAMAKSFSGTAYLDDAQRWMELVGPEGLILEGEEGAVANGRFAADFLETPIDTIYGGSAEILRSLVAEIELRLPKSR